MKLDYLLYSAQAIPEKMKCSCPECGAAEYKKDTDRKGKCKCGTEYEVTDPLILSGLYCWVSAFRDAGGVGAMKPHMDKDYMEKFDVVHVNFTPGHPTYVQAMREILGKSDTKLIVNVDYAASMWGNINPLTLKHQLSMADMVFHVESIGAKILARYIERPVAVLPHPVDVVKIKKLRVQPHNPPVITCQWHRYRGTWDSYYYALYKIPAARILVNMYGDRPPLTDLEVLFNQVMPNMDYLKYMKEVLAPAWLNMDMAPDITQGRGVVDAAALGIPTIGNRSIEAMLRLWPQLIVDYWEHEKIEQLVIKLAEDTEFAKEMSDVGQENCKYYDCEHAYGRMVTALENTSQWTANLNRN